MPPQPGLAKAVHIAPIDGLRALAVAAVLFYHLGFNWIPGGFLGVDVFFVISGYVITRLLLDSIYSANGLDVRQFYAARIRRLLPGLLLLIFLTSIAIALFAPDAIHRFIVDTPFVLTGTNNWHLVSLHQDYFQIVGRPPLLQHTWSLAVESQFYLLWPLLLYFVWRRFGKRSVRRAAILVSAISGSALLALSISADQLNTGRISHVYFGTDTHSIGLFLGSALAVSWIPRNLTSEISERAQDFIDFIGVIGLLGIIIAFLFISENNATLYRIAFPLVGFLSCMMIMSIVHPASRFSRIFTFYPLIWIGQRSYGIYLWHWVIFQITRPGIDLAGKPWALNCARILVVLFFADFSLRYIEEPFRKGLVQDWLRGMRYRSIRVRKNQRIFVGVVLALITLISSSSVALGVYRNSRLVIIPKEDISLKQTIISTTNEGIWLTGDSVILGIKTKLADNQPIALVNAKVGRQIDDLIKAVKEDGPKVPHSKIVLDVGNNNVITKDQMVNLMELIKNQPKIILVNTAVPRVWKDKNNQIISEVVANYPNARLVDWNELSKNHPEFFAPDGVHLVENGSDVYVAAILEALKN
jgi:peptidoglycan/LPS O-acetylase OafA/YrhL